MSGLPIIVSGSSAGKVITIDVTRPNDTAAYTANDVQGSATGSTAAMTFTGLGAANGLFMVTDASLRINISSLPSGMVGFRLHLYNSLPASAYGDNAAWDLPAGDTGYMGYIDFDTPTDLGSTLYTKAKQLNTAIGLDASGNAYGYLVTLGGYTPTAQATCSIRLFGTAI